MENIVYETPDFNVRYVGKKGYEVYETGAAASTKVAAVGNGEGPNLGLERAKAEADRRQALRNTPKPAPAPAKPAPKPMIQSMKPSERLTELNRQIDAEARYGAGGPERITLRAGGTTQTIDNSPEGVARWREAAGKSYGFKDKPATLKPSRESGSTVSGRVRNDRFLASELEKRAPKTVVQDFVADGDFENAQALADHYGIDIKAGMDAKQKRAYQDWQDSKAP